MTGIRRALILIGLALAVMVGGVLPASATFAKSVSLAPITAQTDSIAAPRNLNGSITCADQWNGWAWQSRMTATVTWQRSTSQDVVRYRVEAVVPNYGTLEFTTTDNRMTFQEWALGQRIPVTVTVTAITDYGWTKVSSSLVLYTC